MAVRIVSPRGSVFEFGGRLLVRSISFEKFGEEQLVSRLRRIAPWLLLGPISGLLAEGFYRNLRLGERVLASMYLVAMVATWYDLVYFGKQAIEAL